MQARGRKAFSWLLAFLFICSVMLFGPSQKTGLTNHYEPISRHSPLGSISSFSRLEEPISITSDSDFLEQAESNQWPGQGVEGDPFIIENLTISRDGTCIRVEDTTVRFVIKDCFLSSVSEKLGMGIFFHNVTSGSIEDSIIDSKRVGIYFLSSYNCSVEETIVRNTTNEGFLLRGSSFCRLLRNSATDCASYGIRFEVSDNCTAQDNIASANRLTGFSLSGSSGCTLVGNTASDNLENGFQLALSPRSMIQSNSIHANTFYGILLSNSDDAAISGNRVYGNSAQGMRLYSSDRCVIEDNSVFANEFDGILISESDSCSLLGNLLHGNLEYGVRIVLASSCILYDNGIGWNRVGNSFDDGTNNIWDDDVNRGNSWNDYGGSGVYPIPGGAESVDRYPSVFEDTMPPEIDNPPDVQYNWSTTGHMIRWTVSDYEPDSYEVFRDNIPVISGEWNELEIEVEIDGLEPGQFMYTLLVSDLSGNTANDSVIVTVLSADPTPTIAIAFVLGVSILVLLIYEARERRTRDSRNQNIGQE